jgi:hypothetical protein
VLDAARYAGAALILVAEPGATPPEGLPDGVMVLERPSGDASGGFAGLLGEVAAAIDAGRSPAEALESAVVAVGAVRPQSG